MASKAFFVLTWAVLCCVEGVRIHAPEHSGQETSRTGKYFAGSELPSQVAPNSPDCRKDGLFPNPNACTKYYACASGVKQDRDCPAGMKWDSRRHCTYEQNADCGRTMLRGLATDVECPKDFGYFPFPGDCHKFIVCKENIPVVHTCPEDKWYDDSVGCVTGDRCPQKQNRSNSVVDMFQDSEEE